MSPFPTTLSEVRDFAGQWNPISLLPNLAATSPPSPSKSRTHRILDQEARSASIEKTLPSPEGELNLDAAKQYVPNSRRPVQHCRQSLREDGSSFMPRDLASEITSTAAGPSSKRPSISSEQPQDPNGNARHKRRQRLDTYVIVKPPTTSAKHPLNLQIQLVMRRPVRPRTPGIPIEVGIDNEHDESQTTFTRSARHTCVENGGNAQSAETILEEPLRTPSIALSRTGSLTSTSSGDSTSSSFFDGAKRRVEPMFNLSVHNVMHASMVTDAATDAKVAKFMKRSVEVIGVACLEPSAVWFSQQKEVDRHSQPIETPVTTDIDRRAASIIQRTSPLSPTPTTASERSPSAEASEMTEKRRSLDVPFLKADRWSGVDAKSRRLFGKLFQRRPNAEVALQQSSDAKGSDRPPSPSAHFLRLSRQSSRSSHMTAYTQSYLDDRLEVNNPDGETGRDWSSIGYATLGTIPQNVSTHRGGIVITTEGAINGLVTLVIPANSKLSTVKSRNDRYPSEPLAFPVAHSLRPLGYSWTVRSWAKPKVDLWIKQVNAASARHANLGAPPANLELDSAVVFEWVKLRMPDGELDDEILRRVAMTGLKASRRSAQAASHTYDASNSTPPSPPLDVAQSDSHSSSLEVEADLTPLAVPSLSIGYVNSSGAGSPALSQGKTTEDGEDESDAEDSDTPWTCSCWVKSTGERILLATLTPAPHHPKIVGTLKIPIGLKTVDLGFASNLGESDVDASTLRDGIGLSEENLKDIVCVTAMWLVAREEFGGLGRTKKR